MFEGHYVDWRNSRITTVQKYINTTFFKNKTMIELGGGKGHIGNAFSEMGCKVTSTEVRGEHIDVGKEIHPSLDFELFDCNTQHLEKHYDIVLHWGVLYHIENVKSHLENVLGHCDYLFLETEVLDSDESECILVNENGYDQAYHKVGSRPSVTYIEDILDSAKFLYRRLDNASLNSSFHRYDWLPQNQRNYADGMRRFWICWKAKVPCPFEHKS